MITRVEHRYATTASAMRRLGYEHVDWTVDEIRKAIEIGEQGELVTACTRASGSAEYWAKPELVAAIRVVAAADPDFRRAIKESRFFWVYGGQR